ncbi:hypothetical protein IFR05_008168 [Cadophora sp. M221]|nr:hypothetical protein IFR05_008168 [Cadophora sp. M221]
MDIRRISIPRNQLRDSARSCDTCSIILETNSITTQGETDLLSRYSPKICVEEVWAGAPLQVVGASISGATHEMARAQLYTLAGTEACQILPGVGIGRMVTADALSESTLSIAYEWLKECLATHDECRTPQEPCLPTCVIDVGMEGEEPHLVVSNGGCGKYATLSHCWGDYYPLTTKEKTISQRMNGIPLSDLPKTFRDSVIVTRSLGLRYLWIDLFCIILDSAKDWAEESAKWNRSMRTLLLIYPQM